MLNVMANSVAIAHRAARAVAGVRVTLRYEGKAFNPTGIRGAVDHEASEDEAGGVSFKHVDWLFEQAELFHDSAFVEPKDGYEVDWFDAAGKKHTDVFANREDLRCYRPSDSCETVLRVFAVEKRVSAESDQ